MLLGSGQRVCRVFQVTYVQRTRSDCAWRFTGNSEPPCKTYLITSHMHIYTYAVESPYNWNSKGVAPSVCLYRELCKTYI